MLSTCWKTLQYARHVRGYPCVPETSFVALQGGGQSDMFRVSWPSDTHNISLQEFHAAFLTSPLFRIELFLLSMVSPSQTMTTKHLEAVAAGKEQSFGPWTMMASDGDANKPIGGPSQGTTVTYTRIMQSRIHGRPFCDTWWALEHKDDNTVELLFGTDILRYCSKDRTKSTLVFLLDPFHRMYSRLLLASAKANLLQRKNKHTE